MLSFLLIACNSTEKPNLLILPDYEQLILTKSELTNCIPNDITRQISADLSFLDSAQELLYKFSSIIPLEPNTFIYRHLQSEFLKSVSFQKAYGDWGKAASSEIIAQHDNNFGISIHHDSLLSDSGFMELRNQYLNFIDSMIDISIMLIQGSENLDEISITKYGYTLLDLYSREVIEELNVPGDFFESAIQTNIPYIFSMQEMLSSGKDVGIRRMGNRIEVFYPNFLDSFEIDLLYRID